MAFHLKAVYMAKDIINFIAIDEEQLNEKIFGCPDYHFKKC